MLLLSFFLALAALILQGILVPRIAIFPFAPFLALVIMRCKLKNALWLSALAGALTDLFSDDPMGLYALNFTIASAAIFRIRKHFSHEQPLHVSLLVWILSLLSTSIQWTLLFLFDRRVPFDRKWTLIDLVAMPAIDALYAFVWFAAPLALFGQLRHMWVVFWLKRKNRSPISH